MQDKLAYLIFDLGTVYPVLPVDQTGKLPFGCRMLSSFASPGIPAELRSKPPCSTLMPSASGPPEKASREPTPTQHWITYHSKFSV